MVTYNDLVAIGDNEALRMQFVRSAINSFKGSKMYKTAYKATQYDKRENTTIREYQKLLYTITGRAVPDNYSANYKIGSGFFHRFILQEVQYLLGKGAQWQQKTTADKLGADFDIRLQELAKLALIGGTAFGFFNYDHLETFSLLEFVPLYHEENGALMAGIRFWQVDDNKPLRATLYEVDGITDYLWDGSDGTILKEKRPYITVTKSTAADGVFIYDGLNYDGFPIVPLFANGYKQSELTGLQEQIDCYDLVKSGFADDIDDASQIYWTIQNAGGMDEIDLAEFVQRMRTVKAAVVSDDGAQAESHTIEVPFNSREALLNRIEKDLYKDAMAFNPESVASGAVTATQIKAAYELLNSKCDDFEYQVHDFLQSLLKIAGIEDKAVFNRSVLINTQESIQTIISAATYLDTDYITTKILGYLGDGDQADEMLRKMSSEEMSRFMNGSSQENGSSTNGSSQQNNEPAQTEESGVQ
jgi:SPP1 family phage portal protein